MMSFIKFETKITPVIIKTAYLLGTIYYIYKSISNIPWDYLEYIEFGDLFLGFLLWVFGLIAIRVSCEFTLVLFNALSRLAEKNAGSTWVENRQADRESK